MSGFPILTELPSILLEQIIAKLDWKSYFRLQQTCRQMKEFVRTSRNLYTRVDKNSNFKWIPKDSGEFRLMLEFSNGVADISDVYGVKLKLLGSPRDIMCDFQEFCEAVTKHRISCSILSLAPHPGGFELSKEHCVELIRILSPEEIIMESRGSNRFEALVHSRNLKRLVVFDMDPARICSLIDNLTTQRDVQLKISSAISPIPEEIAQILLSVCQLLRFSSHIHKFQLTIKWDPYSNYGQQLLQKLCQMSLFRKYQIEACGTRHCIEMPSESFCNLTVSQIGSNITYCHRSPTTK